MGIILYADDVAILAPCRKAMSIMLKICEDFATRNNIMYSTNENPELSKTKCLYITGKANKEYPKPLSLYGKDLPWVKNATYLGHEFSEQCNMELDCKIKRSRFIDNSTWIRETFEFAHPNHILSAIQVYASHLFGSNLWSLYGPWASKTWRSWDNAVKRVWDLPLATHRELVRKYLSKNFISLRDKYIPEFIGFFQSLLTSPSFEVRFLARHQQEMSVLLLEET